MKNINNLYMLGHNNIIQKFSTQMRNKKSKRKYEEKKCIENKKDPSPAIKIKFNINSDSIACFVGSKKGNRKSIKTPTSPKKYTKSLSKLQKKSSDKVITNEVKIEKNNESNECKDIIETSLKAIFNETQPSDVKCQWNLSDQQSPQSSQQFYPPLNTKIWSVQSPLQKSYASTVDMHPTLTYYFNNYNQSQDFYIYRQLQQSFLIDTVNIINDPRTTIMIRNIPNKYTIKELSEEIDQILPNTYDFLYLPCDIKNQCNVGYGFINFLTTNNLYEFYQEFHGQKWLKFRSEKICNLTYARLQGLNSLIEHFQNSKVLNQKEKKYRPIIREYAKIGHLIKSQQLL